MASVAKDIIIPEKGVFRIVFLYIGQGEATIMAIPDGTDHRFVLIDCHVDNQFGGIKLADMIKDLTDCLDIFINTHPHNDHLKGIKEISSVVTIGEIWHSGHNPGRDHSEAYDELKELIGELPDDKVETLTGSRSSKTIGDVTVNILAPAEYVVDEIADEDPDTRYRRIHEHCAVIRFSYGSPELTSVIITGDSDLIAWRDHITEYHKERLLASVLSASHHGSRTFFKDKEEDEAYLDHIEAINPDYVIISAPTQEESPHNHPHEDAIETYKEYVGSENVLHLGKNRECIIVDIYEDGSIDVRADKELIDQYGGDTNNESSSSFKKLLGGTVYTSLDRKPMGTK